MALGIGIVVRMIRKALITLVLAATVAGCADVERAPRDPVRCAALFDQFDQLKRIYPQETISSRTGRRIYNPVLERQVTLLRSNRCMTTTTDLAGMESIPLEPADAERTPSSSRTPLIHVGVVTSTSAETRAVAFFGARGYRVRTIGEENLGRRVYVGGFDSEEDVQSALNLARRAGFQSAYVSRFARF